MVRGRLEISARKKVGAIGFQKKAGAIGFQKKVGAIGLQKIGARVSPYTTGV